jgi:hypothetical protein
VAVVLAEDADTPSLLTELHVWIGASADGAEALLVTEMETPIGPRLVTLLAASKPLAEMMAIHAERLLSASRRDHGPLVSIELRAFYARTN